MSKTMPFGVPLSNGTQFPFFVTGKKLTFPFSFNVKVCLSDFLFLFDKKSFLFFFFNNLTKLFLINTQLFLPEKSKFSFKFFILFFKLLLSTSDSASLFRLRFQIHYLCFIIVLIPRFLLLIFILYLYLLLFIFNSLKFSK